MVVPTEAPIESIPVESSPLDDTVIVAAVTGLLTYGVRKWLTRKDAGALDDKPQILFWVSAVGAVVGGGLNGVLRGRNLKESLFDALYGWLSMQGIRRLKKGAGVS